MTNRPSRRLVLAGATAMAGCSTLPSLSEPEAIVWTFDRLDETRRLFSDPSVRRDLESPDEDA